MNSSDQALHDLNQFIDSHEVELIDVLLLLFSKLKKKIQPSNLSFIQSHGYFPPQLLNDWKMIISKFTEEELTPILNQKLSLGVNAESENRLVEVKTQFANQILNGIENNLELIVRSNLPPELWFKVLLALWGLNASQVQSGLRYYNTMLADGAKLSIAERNLKQWANERKDYRAENIATYFLAETFNQALFTNKEPGKLLVWVTSHDERVCPVCKPMNGRVVSAWEAPPAHLRCRCSVKILK